MRRFLQSSRRAERLFAAVGACALAGCAPKAPQLAEDLPPPQRQVVSIVTRGEELRDDAMKQKGLARLTVAARDVQEPTRVIEMTELRLLSPDGKILRQYRLADAAPFTMDSVPAGSYRLFVGRIGYVATIGAIRADSGCAMQVEAYLQRMLMGLGSGVPSVLTGRMTVTTCGAAR